MATGSINLLVYKKAFSLAMDVYRVTKDFPQDEIYGLTSQIRRCTRSVCSSIGEAYRKRLYPAHFVSKMSDADMENSETQVWLDFALACNYISKSKYNDFCVISEEVGRLLNHTIKNQEKYK